MKKIILLIIEKIRKTLKVDEKGNSFGWGIGTLLLTALMMVGCENKSVAEIEEEERLNGFNIIVADSCEYLKDSETFGYSGYGYLSHKGNCRFCKERDSIKWEKRKKELKELINQLKEK